MSIYNKRNKMRILPIVYIEIYVIKLCLKCGFSFQFEFSEVRCPNEKILTRFYGEL